MNIPSPHRLPKLLHTAFFPPKSISAPLHSKKAGAPNPKHNNATAVFHCASFTTNLHHHPPLPTKKSRAESLVREPQHQLSRSCARRIFHIPQQHRNQKTNEQSQRLRSNVEQLQQPQKQVCKTSHGGREGAPGGVRGFHTLLSSVRDQQTRSAYLLAHLLTDHQLLRQ